MLKSQPYIILVDIDNNNIERLSFSLACFGIRTKVFKVGFEVVTYLNQIAGTTFLPSLIIIDHNLPSVSARQILILLKNNMLTRQIPVIIYSEEITSLYCQSAIKCGAHSCLRKCKTQLEFSEHVKIFKDIAWKFTTIDTAA